MIIKQSYNIMTNEINNNSTNNTNKIDTKAENPYITFALVLLGMAVVGWILTSWPDIKAGIWDAWHLK